MNFLAAMSILFLHGTVDSFVIKQQPLQWGVSGVTRTSVSNADSISLFMSVEDSEWYSPPPKKEVAVQIPSNVSPRIDQIESFVEYEEFIHELSDLDLHGSETGDFEEERLSIIFFHAKWCRTCRKVGRLYEKLALREADLVEDRTSEIRKRGTIRLASAEYSVNSQLVESLKIQKLPTFAFYKNGQHIKNIPATPSDFSRIQDAVKYYRDLTMQDVQLEGDLERAGEMLERTGVVFPARSSNQRQPIKAKSPLFPVARHLEGTH